MELKGNKETHHLGWSVEPNCNSFRVVSVIQRCVSKSCNTKIIADNWVEDMQTQAAQTSNISPGNPPYCKPRQTIYSFRVP